MTRVPGFRRQIARIVAVVIVILSGPTDSIWAQWTLTPLWSDVTPGRITVEPWGVGSGPDAGVMVATEDRWIRRWNAQGDVVAGGRIGLRDPAGVLHEAPHHALLIPNRSRPEPLVRIDYAGAAVQTVGRPVSHHEALPEDARFVVVDGQSLIYSVSPSGLVTHASSAGGMIWQRRLPGIPTAVAEYRGAVYVALADGGVYRFDGNGTGIELFRLGAPVVAIHGVATTAPQLLTLDEAGKVTLVSIAGGLSNEVTIRWRVAMPAGAVLPAARDRALGAPLLEVAPPQEPSESWYAVVARSTGGIVMVNSDGTTLRTTVLEDGMVDHLLVGRLPSGGFMVVSQAQLLLVSSAGSVMSQVALRQVPARVTWISTTQQLIVGYADWIIEAWTVAPAMEAFQPLHAQWSHPVPQGRRDVNAFPPGAFTARAEAVLVGTSRSERRTLIAQIADQRRRAVLFNRVGEVRTILRRMVREPWDTSEGQAAGADGTVRRDFPEIRRAAVAELGRYMDHTSRGVLTDVVRYDPDYQVVTAALRAFAGYGVDDTGVTEHAIARFRGADDRGRAVLGPAIIELLELTAAAQRHPAAAEAALDLLIESNLSRDIRRRATTIERAGRR